MSERRPSLAACRNPAGGQSLQEKRGSFAQNSSSSSSENLHIHAAPECNSTSPTSAAGRECITLHGFPGPPSRRPGAPRPQVGTRGTSSTGERVRAAKVKSGGGVGREHFAVRIQKIPDHWRFVGSRQSPLTGGPRLAMTPVHAILNYVFALLEAETRLAISSLGLDPGLGLGLHTDTADRSSLAFDVLEPVRPQVETWLLDWIAREPLRRADFFETATGNCRLMSPMCTKLSGTVSVWGKLVAPWAQYAARTLWAGQKSRPTGNSVPPTRLTQQRRTEAKGKVWIAAVEPPKTDHLCRGCGKTITNESTHCANCAVDRATERLIGVASLGRKAARSPEARAKQGATQRRHGKACSEWDASTQPDWLTSRVFSQQIQPLLAKIRTSAIRSRIGVSRWYAGRIRQGYCPHPRHWEALAKLVKYQQTFEKLGR